MFSKKITKVLVCMLTVFMMSSPVYAKTRTYRNYPDVTAISEKLPRTMRESCDFVTTVLKGAFFSAADLKITNENGDIGVTAHSYMSKPVDELYMTIYIDRWLEDEQRWAQVVYYDFEFYGEDYPDGLTSETVEFIVDNQPKGYYYRLRGSYAALKDGSMEGFGPVTDGVLIE